MTDPHALELEAVIFDLDGVVTDTAAVHAAAWKATFDEVLERAAAQRGEPFVPFDAVREYLAFVDGRPRDDGIRRFLAARAIPVNDDDVAAIGARKNARFVAHLDEHGVATFAGTVELIDGLRAYGVKTALVTSSRNGRAIVERAGLAASFDAVLDGEDLATRSLRGKPDPDGFLACAELLDVAPSHAAVVEDAVAGVTGARRGNFGLVIGVDRGGNREALRAGGADLVVGDLGGVDAALLDERFRARRERAAWRVEQEGLDPVREHAMESLFAVGNGYLGVRGSPELLMPGSQGDLFVAGIYDRKHAERPYSEHEFMNVGGDSDHAELVSAPFPFRVRIAIDGRALDLAHEPVRAFRRVLNLKRAVLHTRLSVEHRGQAVTVRSRRCASAAEPHLLLHELSVDAPSGAVVEIDASLADPDLAHAHPHLAPQPAPGPDVGELFRFRTRSSGYELCIASRAEVAGAERHGMRWTLRAAREPVVLRRYVVVHTDRDGVDPVRAALADLAARGWDGFDAAWRRHAARWRTRWRSTDIRIDGGYATEQALRFNSYHLHSTAARDAHVSVGARALTGRAYEGHVFWDVEVFMLPFWLHTEPRAARNALRYRHHTLAGARARARATGCRGACYAWESTVTGEDVTPRVIRLKSSGREIPIFTGDQQIHVTADVAFGVWRYWDATLDGSFMRDTGSEVLFETARYWMDRSVRGDGGRFHIRGVVGPDEYHHSVDDNAYTNWMVRFNLERAAWAADWLDAEFPAAARALRERLDLGDREPAAWAERARLLYCPQPGADGVIEQFAGFFALEEYPLPTEERLKAPVHRLFDWERINRLKLIKQADVLMLPFLFPQWFSDDIVAANYHYYEPLTDHGSSLSPGVHAAIAARLGLRDAAHRYWRQSLWLDLSNVMTNSALGVHPACMGATWQALVSGFLGLRFDGATPAVDPAAMERVPRRWRSVALEPKWRGARRRVEVSR